MAFRRSRGRAALPLAILLLAACDDYGRVTQTSRNPTYQPEELAFAGSPEPGGLLVLIHGNPTDEPRPVLAGRVHDALERAAPARNIRLTSNVQEGDRGIYRVIIVFDPATPVPDGDLCAGRVPPTRTPGDEITVRAAFCRGGVPLSGALGVMDADPARDHPDRFDRFLHDVGTTLFPAQDQRN
jgi:hypothetical protein